MKLIIEKNEEKIGKRKISEFLSEQINGKPEKREARAFPNEGEGISENTGGNRFTFCPFSCKIVHKNLT